MVGPSLTNEQQQRLSQLGGLLWLADAPLFIDETLVQRFFDAVVRPKYEHVGESEQKANETEDKILSGMGLKGVGGLNLPEWLKPIKLEVEVKGELTAEQKAVQKHSTVSQLKPIWNAERQLEELTRHYLAHHRSRIIAADAPLDPSGWPQERKWYEADRSSFTDVPRAIGFLDLPAGAQILPMAAEFTDGKVVLLYEELVAQLTGESGGPMRKYPDDVGADPDKFSGPRKDYWSSFQRFYDSRKAMTVVEQASSAHGRISWIDFRIPLDKDGSTIHLHVAPGGKADAGIFGYNFIRRAHRHGVRLVGALKSGPDMNVMAIYEK